jgi:KDO2-lipid IV(A) lauroyltransferase
MKIRHIIEYLLVLLVRLPALILPRRAAIWYGRRLGDLVYLLDIRHRRDVMNNLDLAYRDEISAREKKKIAIGSYRHFASMLVDLLCSPYVSRKKLEKISEVIGWENLEEACARGRGVLILTAHLGVWEMMGVAQGYRGLPLNVVARRLDNPLLEKILHRYRTRSGNTVLFKQNAVKAILEVLHQKQATAVLIDQNVSAKHGIFVDFFGVPACTTTVISAIALKTGAPVVPAFSLPLPGGRWQFIYDKPMEFTAEGNRIEAIRDVTQQCTRIIEDYIRKRPEAWLWMHRRWKTRPPEESVDAG